MEPKVYSVELKVEALRRMEAGESPSALARELGVRRNRLYKWRDRVRSGQVLHSTGRPRGSESQPKKPDSAGKRMAELERLVGQLTMEKDFFKGALRRVEELRRANREAGAEASSPRSRR